MGKLIAGEAAKYLKPCVLELGGKSAAVVCFYSNFELNMENVHNLIVLTLFEGSE